MEKNLNYRMGIIGLTFNILNSTWLANCFPLFITVKVALLNADTFKITIKNKCIWKTLFTDGYAKMNIIMSKT